MQEELMYDTNEFSSEEESEADEEYGGANATRDKHRLSEQHDARRTVLRYERVLEGGRERSPTKSTEERTLQDRSIAWQSSTMQEELTTIRTSSRGRKRAKPDEEYGGANATR